MSNIKKIIEEEQRRKQAERNKEDERFRNSRVFQQSSGNNRKAEKLLSFAPSVLRRFAKEVGAEFEYAGTDSSHGSCLACYYQYRYEETFWRRKRYKASEVIIGTRGHTSRYGYVPGGVVMISHQGYGDKESLDEINEEWFIRILAKHYS
jgi:hypothetical protein